MNMNLCTHEKEKEKKKEFRAEMDEKCILSKKENGKRKMENLDPEKVQHTRWMEEKVARYQVPMTYSYSSLVFA